MRNVLEKSREMLTLSNVAGEHQPPDKLAVLVFHRQFHVDLYLFADVFDSFPAFRVEARLDGLLPVQAYASLLPIGKVVEIYSVREEIFVLESN